VTDWGQGFIVGVVFGSILGFLFCGALVLLDLRDDDDSDDGANR